MIKGIAFAAALIVTAPAYAGSGFGAGFGMGLYDYSNQLNQQAYQQELLRLQQENLRLQQQQMYNQQYIPPSTVTNCFWSAGIQTCFNN